MVRRIVFRRMAKRVIVLVAAACGIVAYHEIRDHRSAPRADAATIELGRDLFAHRWTPGDPLAGGDGLGPVFNEVSCAACHSDPGTGGSGPVEKNALLFDVRKLVKVQRPVVICNRESHVEVQVPMASLLVHGGVHRRATQPEFQESRDSLGQAFQQEPGHRLEVTARNTMPLWGSGLIDRIPDSAILRHAEGGGMRVAVSSFTIGLRAQSGSATDRAGLESLFQNDNIHGRAYRLPGGRVGRFGWRADFATLQEFTEAACANELGLSNPGHDQPAPLVRPDYKSPGFDLTRQQCEAITAFLRALPPPVQEVPSDPADRAAAADGRQIFAAIGCANCHVPKLGPVEGLYSDLLLHDMADPQSGPYGASLRPEVDPSELTRPSESEWRTPPLWGVADSAPYMHNGGAASLEDAIRAHRGTARVSAQRFAKLHDQERASILVFLRTLRAPIQARTRQMAAATTSP